MNPADTLTGIVETIVRADSTLDQAFAAVAGWIDVGVPPVDGPYPCIRLDSFQQSAGKWNTYFANVKVWSQDMGAGFFDLVEALATALQASDQVLSESYLHRPETGLNCAILPVTFTA